MIIDQILSFINWIVYGIFDVVLPTGTPVDNKVIESITWLYTKAYSFDWIFPVDTAISVVLVLIGFFTLVALFELARFIINIIRGAGA